MNLHQRFGICLFGHACCYSWLNSVLFIKQNPLISFDIIICQEYAWSYTAAFVALVGLLFGIYFLKQRRLSLLNQHPALTIISFGTFLLGYLSSHMAMRIVLMAIGFVSLKLTWDLFLPDNKLHHRYVWLPVFVCSITIGLMATADTAFADIVSIAVLLLSLLSSLLLSPYRNRKTRMIVDIRPKQKISFRFSRTITVAIESFFLGLTAFLVTISQQYPTYASFTYEQNIGIVACSFLLAGALMAIDVFRGKYYHQSFLLRLSVIGLVPCFYFLPKFDGYGITLCGCILLFIMIRHFNYAQDFLLQKMRNERNCDHFDSARASSIHSFGFLMGFTFCNMLMTYSESELSLSIIGFLGIYILVLTALFLPILQDFFGVVKRTGGLGAFKRKADRVIEIHQLTPRQSEVFKLLYKGRNAEYIARDLSISSATAKTHIYTIYSKLGVHSQQELMDVVNNIIMSE